MAYDLPFMSKARKAIPSLPTNPPRTPLVDEVEYGGYNANTPPWLQGTNVGERIQYEDVREGPTPADQVLNTRYWQEFGGDTSTPDWLRGTQVGEPITPAPESVWQGPVRPGYRRNPTTGFPEPIPGYAGSDLPTATPTSNEPRTAVTRLSMEEEMDIDTKRRNMRLGTEYPEEAAAPGSPFSDRTFSTTLDKFVEKPSIDPAHLATAPIEYYATPGGTRIPFPYSTAGTDLSIPIPYESAALGSLAFFGSLIDIPMMPEDAALNTALNVIQGQPITLGTDGFRAAVDEYRGRSMFAQFVTPTVAFSSLALAARASRKSSSVAARQSARQSRMDRGLVTAFNPDPRYVATRTTKETLEAAEALNEAMDDIIRDHSGTGVQKTDIKFGPPDDAYEVVTPNALGLRMIEGGVDDVNVANNIVRGIRNKTLWRNIDDYMKPILDDADHKLSPGGALDNAASVVSAKVAFLVNKHFRQDGDGLIHSLRDIDMTLDKDVGYAPGIQDVAERLPTFAPHLTTEVDGISQLQAMEEIRKLLQPWAKLFPDVGLETPEGAKVLEGGFYMPRGSRVEVEDEAQKLINVGRDVKYVLGSPRKGFERDREFPSYSMGVSSKLKTIEKNKSLTKSMREAYTDYPKIAEAISGYIQDVGERAIGEHTIKLLKNLRDKTGTALLASSPTIRMHLKHGPVKADQIRLRNNIAGYIRRNQANEGVVSELLRQRRTEIREVAESAVQVSRREMKVQDLHVNGSDTRVLNLLLDESIVAAKTIHGEALKATQMIRDVKGQISKTEQAWVDLVGRYMAELEDLASFKKMADWEQENVVPYQGVWQGGTYSKIGDRRVGVFEPTLVKDLSHQYRPMRSYFAAVNRLTRMHSKLDEMVDAKNSLEDTVDGLISSRQTLKDLNAEQRAERVAINRQLRLLGTRDLQERSLKASIKVWEMEEYRRLRKLAATEGKIDKYKDGLKKTYTKIQELKDESSELTLKWNRLLEGETTPPPGRARLDKLFVKGGMENYDYPVAMANWANKYLNEHNPDAVKRYGIGPLKSFNRTTLGLMTTLDDSGWGIQGLLGMTGIKGLAPGTENFRQLLKMHAQSWGDPHVLGAFMFDFDKKEFLAGRLSSEEWSTLSKPLRIGGINTEYRFTLGEKIPLVGPTIRATNRAFGYLGDAWRLNLASDMLEMELSRGRSLKEIVDSGDAANIAEIANNMTGWSSRRDFGDIGELALLAPRFLQARAETLVKAALGTLPVVTKRGVRFGYRLDHRIARRSLTRLMMFSAIMTETINTMQGKETDWRPIIKGPDGSPRWNPNFMRFHVPFINQDVTMLGPYDSILRMGFGIGVGLYHLAQDKNLDRWEDVIEPFRAGASGAAATAVDLFYAKSTWSGKPIDDIGDILRRLSMNYVPMSTEKGVESALQYGGKPYNFDWINVPKTTFAVGLEVVGIKSSPESILDVKENLAREILAGMPKEERDEIMGQMEPMSFYDKLSGKDFLYDDLPIDFKVRYINNHPDIVTKSKDLPERYKGSIEERVAQNRHEYSRETARLEDDLYNQIVQGVNGAQLDEAISNYKQGKFASRSSLLESGEVGEYLSKRTPSNKLDMYKEQFWDAPLNIRNHVTGEKDWDAQEDFRTDIVVNAFADLGEDMGVTLERMWELFETPLPTGIERLDKAVLQNYNWHKDMRPVYDAEEAHMQLHHTPEQRLTWEQYRTGESSFQTQFKRDNPQITNWESAINRRKVRIRMETVDENGYHYVDVAAVRLGAAPIPGTLYPIASNDGFEEHQRMLQEGADNSSRYEDPAVLRPAEYELTR